MKTIAIFVWIDEVETLGFCKNKKS